MEKKKMKYEENEIDLFDEFKIKPMTQGLGFYDQSSEEDKILKKKEKYKKASKAFLNVKEFDPLNQKNRHLGQDLNHSHHLKKPLELNFVQPSKHSPKEEETYETQPRSSQTSLLDRQFAEMNQLMEKLNTSYDSLKKSKKSFKQEENETLSLEPLELEELKPQVEGFQKKIFTPHHVEQHGKDSSLFLAKAKRVKKEVAKQVKKEVENQKPYKPYKPSRPSKLSKPSKKFSKPSGPSQSSVNLVKPQWISVSYPSLRVFFIDFFLIAGLSTLFLITLPFVLGFDLMTFLTYEAQRDGVFYLSFGVLCMSSLFLYFIISRSFFGKTIGEWIFSYRLGSASQRQKAFYPLLVLWRMILISGTGLIFFPIFSFLLRKDILFYFTGLKLFKRA